MSPIPPQDHPAVDGAYPRDGHDDRIEIIHDICHLRFKVVDLAIKEFDLLDRVAYQKRRCGEWNSAVLSQESH